MNVWRKTRSMYVQSDISHFLYFQCQEFPGYLPPKDLPHPFPSPLHIQSPPCSENRISLVFREVHGSLHVGDTKPKSSAQNIDAPTLFSRGNIQLCVTSGATPKIQCPSMLPKIHPQILRLVPGRIPRQPSCTWDQACL